jgi:hypothetical protein
MAMGRRARESSQYKYKKTWLAVKLWRRRVNMDREQPTRCQTRLVEDLVAMCERGLGARKQPSGAR